MTTTIRPSRMAQGAALAVLLLSVTPQTSAQDPVTTATVLEGSKRVLGQLQDVGTTLTGNGQVAIVGTVTQLSQLIAELEALTRNNVAAPINNLSQNARVIAERLVQTTKLLDGLLAKQRECIFLNMDVFLAGVNTAGARLKSGVILMDPGAPRLASFRFEGLKSSNLVPKSGGAVRLSGFKLWPASDLPPDVSLVTDSNNVLAKLKPKPGSSADEVAVAIDPSMVKQNAGRCLQVAVSTYDKKSFLGIKYGKQGTGHPTLPLCIPAEYNRTVSIRAELAYSVTSQIEIALSPRRFGWGNDSCEERKNYSHTEDWGAEIPPGYRIVRVHESNPDIRNQTGIGVSYQATSATAAGWLDDASCFEGPFGIAKFFHDTHWYMTLTPTIAGPKTNQHSSSATAGPVPMAPEHTRVCAMVPKEAAATGSSTFSIVLTQYVQGEPLPAPLYQGPLKTAPDASEFAYDDKVPGYEIGSTYNPTVVNGLSQICATVKSTAACGW